MLNSLAAAFRLTTHQLLGGRRRILTLIAFLLPVALALLSRTLIPARVYDPTTGYAAVLVGVYVAVFVPFMAVYWGAALLTDEIDGKTLVYLWTRPAGRARMMVFKFLVAFAWLSVLTALSLAATWLVLAWRPGAPPALHNLLTIVWDTRALTLGALAYGGFAFFLSSLLKKPLMVALLYVYSLDLFAAVLPGYLKLISVRHYVMTLTTQKEEAPNSRQLRKLLQLVEETPTTEAEAIWTLAGAALVLLILGALLLRSREFLGDDPARER